MFLQDLALAVFIVQLASQAKSSAAQTIDPGSVNPVIRDGWCTSQEALCSKLCGAEPRLNTCILSNFEVECQCDGTFVQPDYEIYKGSLAYFVCEEWIRQCVAGNSTNSENQAECRAAYTCPSLDPDAVAQTSSSPEASQTPGSSPPPTPSPTPSPSPSPSSTSQVASSQQSLGSSNPTSVGQSSSSQTTTTPGRSIDTSVPSDSTIPSNTEMSPRTSSSDSPSAPRTTNNKSLGGGAIAGIAVGVGVPVLLGSIFLAYRLGSRRMRPPVPIVPHSAFDKEYGGNQYPGGGNDPGVGFGNEVGGIAGRDHVANRT
ncbi:hypothetical protein TWF730_003955 [Orbilia blumenaviensis]|uniref:DUF7707 domain-containing protein n=1 Tax=Orbilia blumenaviensis TaxID=1796055 RepID=A0AAV9U1C2_9PEZI